jgi:DNA-directed RNA polymerase subunit beta'
MEARVLMMSTNNILSPASGRPIINPTQDIVLGLYYMTRQRPFAKGEYVDGREKKGDFRGIYSSPDEVRMAYDAGEVTLHARIKCRVDGEVVDTTVGRVLVSEVLPEKLDFSLINRVLTKKALSEMIDACYRAHRNKATVLLADRMRSLGFEMAAVSGVSICMDDMLIPPSKKTILDQAQSDVETVIEQYQEGLITDGERYNKIVDIWAAASDQVASDLIKGISNETAINRETGEKKETASFNPIFMMADSGARGSNQQIRQLAGMRGLMAKPSGEIIETPITANFREGLTVLQYFISTHGARKGLADTALKTANSGYLTRRLVDVAQDAVVTEHDCGTLDGIEITKLEEGGEVVQGLGERILGRTGLEDIYDPRDEESVLVKAGEEIDEAKTQLIEESGIEKVTIRSVLTCATRRGICALCYGRDLARGYRVNIGEAVGVIAAQSIGEPGTQLTMRTFHIGGAAARGKIEQSSIENRFEGKVKLEKVKTVTKKDGTTVVMNRHGVLKLVDDSGREKETYNLVYGAFLKVKEGDAVAKGTVLADWDPYAIPILTEVPGIVKYGDIIDGVTMEEKLDEVTGLSRRVVIESRDPSARPRISIKDDAGETKKTGVGDNLARYMLPVGSNIIPPDGTELDAGEILAKIPRETTKTKDITGGLPRVAELFEARKPKDHAIVAEIDGTVTFGKDTKGKRKVLVQPEVGEAKEYLIAKGKHLTVKEGDYVRAGEPLMDGPANPHDILKIKGEKELAAWLVNEIQQVYRLQGVGINDKHIETIVRMMLRRIRVRDPGDTNFLADEQVEKAVFERENEKVLQRGGSPAIAEPLLLGITKASLSTESFISASSFQETTKVLTEAAINGKVDELRGLKENVIMGRLLPAGTGLSAYKRLDMIVEDGSAASDYSAADDLLAAASEEE